MNCRSCGTPLSSEQKFCPNCGNQVINTVVASASPSPNGFVETSSINNYNNVINVPSNNFNVPSGYANASNVNVNVNTPSDIGFNNGGNFSSDVLFNNVNNSFNQQIYSKNSFSNSNQGFDSNLNMGMQMELPDKGNGKKRGFPWFAIAGVLIVIMVVGLVGVPLFNKQKISTYESDAYKMEYNGNWTLDEDAEKMTLYYSDNDSRFLLNAVSTFESLKFAVNNEEDKKTLYKAFYDAWSKVDGGMLTGGTNTFLTLNDETMYARVDYKMIGRENIGAFYVIVSQKNNRVISFMSYCNQDNWNTIDNDVMKMLNSLTYKSEAESSSYKEFKAGVVKDYSAIGYMDYKVPDCWTLDEERTKNVSYKSYIFKFRDGVSLLDVKGVTPYDSTINKTGTTYEAMKASAAKKYGGIVEEKTININNVKWYVIITPNYTSGNKSYHNELYFAFSDKNTHLYYFEAYVSNETSENKTSFFNESIEYILKSVKLYKVND